MSTTAIVPAHEVQVTEVTLSEPKVNKAGGKGVQLKYAGQPFQLRLPRSKFPAGLISREDAASGNVNYSLIASLKGCDPFAKERSTDPEMGPVYNFMLDLQELLVSWATENSAKLFGKKRSVESVRDSFKNLLSVSTEKQGDEYVPNGKYPPSLRLKVPVYDGRVTMDAVNSQMIPYHLTVDSLKSVFPKYVEANLVISPSVYVIGQGFGVTWGIKFAQVFPKTEDPDLSILVNRAVSGRYNLGSSFKPFVAFAALDSGQLSGGSEYEYLDLGSYKLQSIPNGRCQDGVKCVFRNAICASTGSPCRYGVVNVESALAVSSDAFFYKIGEQILTERGYQPILENEVRKFGFGSPTNIDLPYEYAGTIPNKALKKRMADIGAISKESGQAYYVGDQILFSIGQGLLSATPIQTATAYGTLGNGGNVMKPHVVKAILTPGTPDKKGVANIGFINIPDSSQVVERFDDEQPASTLGLSEESLKPIVRGLQRVIRGPGTNFGTYHKTTGELLFRGYPYAELPIAGKTGTAQGFGNLPWNDSSAFGAFSLSPRAEYKYAAFAYLEKSGYGSQAAAPVVKCMYIALAGKYRFDPLTAADPLNTNGSLAAQPTYLRNPSCLVSGRSESRD